MISALGNHFFSFLSLLLFEKYVDMRFLRFFALPIYRILSFLSLKKYTPGSVEIFFIFSTILFTGLRPLT